MTDKRLVVGTRRQPAAAAPSSSRVKRRRAGTTSPSSLLDVEGMAWDDFLAWFREHWQPGEHVAFVAPTGEGKTTTAVGILKQRKYVLALDPKGGDSTLKAAGFERITKWDKSTLRMIQRKLEEDQPVRLIVGPVVETREDLLAMRELFSKVLKDVFRQGGWTVYVDELQVLSDRRLMNLAGDAEALLIAARDKGVSFVSSFQRPANVPRTASDQSTWFVVFHTRDIDVVNRLAEMAGQSKAVMRGAIKGLPRYACLVFNRNPRQPIIATKAKKVR